MYFCHTINEGRGGNLRPEVTLRKNVSSVMASSSQLLGSQHERAFPTSTEQIPPFDLYAAKPFSHLQKIEIKTFYLSSPFWWTQISCNCIKCFYDNCFYMLLYKKINKLATSVFFFHFYCVLKLLFFTFTFCHAQLKYTCATCAYS